MKTAWKILAFSILLNISIGIMIHALPTLFGENDIGDGNRLGLTYSDEQSSPFTSTLQNGNEFTTGMEGDITPSGELQDAGDEGYRLLDMMNIGFLARFASLVKTYLFGFIKLLDVVFGSAMDTELYTFLFGGGINPGVLYTAMGFCYVIAAFSLWTGKDLDQ